MRVLVADAAEPADPQIRLRPQLQPLDLELSGPVAVSSTFATSRTNDAA